MKQQVEDLISRLASKELTLGCRVEREGAGRKTDRYLGTLIAISDSGFYVQWDGLDAPALNRDTHKLVSLGHPILIGDVLEKLEEHFAWGYRETSKKALASTTKYEDKTVAKLWRLWKACGGADKSLQEIVADTEWAPEQQPNGQPSHVIGSMILLVPKQKPIRDLFEFLLPLNLAE